MMLNLYFYGELGPVDENSPSFYLERAEVKRFLAAIARGERTDESEPDAATVAALIRVGLLAENRGGFYLPFPFILEEDIVKIEALLDEPVRELSAALFQLRDELWARVAELRMPFAPPRLLYHCLCDKLFDGTAFDWLASLLCTEKPQPNGATYLPVGFEARPAVDRLADQLLCSSHNLRLEGLNWNSFGDGAGSRHCLFRLSRVLRLHPERLEAFVGPGQEWFIEDIEASLLRLTRLMKQCIATADRGSSAASSLTSDRQAASFLQALGYLDARSGAPRLPVFAAESDRVLQGLTERVMPLAERQFRRVLDGLSSLPQPLAATKQGATPQELGNELWHQLFGRVNERLVTAELVAEPPFHPGQGRYLKAIWLD